MARAAPGFLYLFLKRAEAVKLRAYQDSAGVWTIGVGHTDQRNVHAGLVITMKEVDAFLAQDVEVAIRKLEAVVSEAAILAMTDHEYAAILSFVFNLGVNAKWTIWSVLNARSFAAVPAQMMRFTKARIGGQLRDLPGLVARRRAEVTLWETADVRAAVITAEVGAETALSSGFVREEVTQPTPVDFKPMSKTSLATKIVGTTAAVGAGATQIKDLVEPASWQVPAFARIAAILTVVVVACGLVGLLIMWLQHKARHR